MLAPLGAAEVLDRGQLLVQRAQLARRLLGMALRFPCGGQRARVAQAPAGVAPQRVHVELLAFAVRVGIAPVVAGEPPGHAEILPVRGHIHGAVELRWVDEALGDQHRVPVLCLPVVAETAQHRGKRERRKAGKHPLRAKNQEPCVIRDQMQSPPPQSLRPADPAVAVPAFERARLPAGERDPPSAPFDDVPKAAPGEPLEAETVVLVDEFVPLPVFVGARETDHDIGQGKPFRCRCEDRWVGRWSIHAPIVTTLGAQKSAKNETPGNTRPNRHEFLAWDGPATVHGRLASTMLRPPLCEDNYLHRRHIGKIRKRYYNSCYSPTELMRNSCLVD